MQTENIGHTTAKDDENESLYCVVLVFKVFDKLMRQFLTLFSGRFQANQGAGATQSGEDGWTSVSKAPRSIVDPSRMRLTKQPDENVSLGPGGRPGMNWHKGAGGGQGGGLGGFLANKSGAQEVDRLHAQTPNR